MSRRSYTYIANLNIWYKEFAAGLFQSEYHFTSAFLPNFFKGTSKPFHGLCHPVSGHGWMIMIGGIAWESSTADILIEKLYVVQSIVHQMTAEIFCDFPSSFYAKTGGIGFPP